MGSTNFLQHNPNQTNQETDPAYAADPIRSGGLGTDDIVPSPWMNKALFQATTFVAAFAQALANKGYALSDSDISTLTTVLSNVLTNADTKPNLITVAYSATPTFDASKSNGFDFVMNGNVTSSTLSNMAIGQVVTFVITQSATGGNTFVPPANVTGFEPIQSAANSVTVQSFIKNEAGNIVPYTGQPYWIPTAAQLGFSNGNNGNGYWEKDPLGKIEQWGQVTTDINAGTVYVPFPIAFTNLNSIAVLVATYSPTDRITYIQYGSISVNGFTVGNNGSSGYAMWRAVGY